MELVASLTYWRGCGLLVIASITVVDVVASMDRMVCLQCLCE